MSNSVPTSPLLDMPLLPPFDRLRPEDVEPAIAELIDRCCRKLQEGLNKPGWESTLAPLEEVQDQLNRAFSPVSHLNSVLSGPWRAPYEAALARVTAYWTELGQNRDLYAVYQQLADSPAFSSWPQQRKKAVELGLRDFVLGGVGLEGRARETFAANSQRLAELSSRFANNVLDATNAWTWHTEDESELSGLPQTALAAARAAAQSRGLEGWVITLEGPSYLAVMTHADNRDLRERVHKAYVSRASDTGPNGGEFDNSAVMEEILRLRSEQARLLGMANYAELSLASKMAPDTDKVLEFLGDLAARAKPAAERDFAELQAFAAEKLGLAELQPWDIAWASEKLKRARYAVSQEELRPYFPYRKVLVGLFAVVEKLFGVTVEEDEQVPCWHRDVQFFWLQRNGERIAGFYLDPFARENKRGGAWMDSVCVRRQTTNGLQLPVAYLVCNFSAPTADKPSLLTHYEVTTLFHEFGHGLHHMLTKVDVAAVSGINGVAWDAVELPSQFLENWCWQPEVIAMISGHFETGEPLPQTLLERMLAAKNFQSAMFTVRQLEFALFDFKLHCLEQGASAADIQQLLDKVRAQVAVVPVADENRFQHSFSHIFAGGYAAGYYSYKWAEVLSADAFSLFEEKGIFDAATGERFLHAILEQGGSRDALDLFTEFRGREPRIDALLRHSGIEQQELNTTPG
ncbi:M3 family metallopeptidase [Microbulbifer thermotolerans]|uniref:M3 family metallopeptidase n=1 Tax=Microbulbifer thermotolerans TaxID=252514 RepID=UPI0022493126|nr:M3 family metallopeptidase [Microbulbifer thermotolerans]MCX2793960.1 M3 family metallopeptidase [Microbulbifer thermotolerans]MCX2830846.1 M3 family metallopeptidase [Microbulbifer thermotolerans]MCX2840859.1 M3 family metallopeptidase [Microbulbifer thermotolerans]